MNPETTSGGRALAFYASIRINVRAGEKIPNPKNKDESIGHVINITVAKNKTAVPFKKASFDLFYAAGVNKKKEIVDISIETGWITRAGAYYQVKDENGNKVKRTINEQEIELSFQGKDSLIEYIESDEELYKILEEAVMTGIAPTLEQIKGQMENSEIETSDQEETTEE